MKTSLIILSLLVFIASVIPRNDIKHIKRSLPKVWSNYPIVRDHEQREILHICFYPSV